MDHLGQTLNAEGKVALPSPRSATASALSFSSMPKLPSLRQFASHIPGLRRLSTVPPVPETVGECTAKWVEDVLRYSGVLAELDENKVMGLTKENLSGGGSTGAHVVRLKLTYAVPDPSLPSSVIFKFSDVSHMVTPAQRPSVMERAIMHGAGYSDVRMVVLETSFYEKYGQMIANASGVHYPQAYYSQMVGGSTGSSALMFILFGTLESARGCIVMRDMAGAKIYDAVDEIPLEGAIRLAVTLARLHGGTAKQLWANPGQYDPIVGRAFNYDMNSMSIGLAYMAKRDAFGWGSYLASYVKANWATSDLKALVDEPDLYEALRVFVRKYARINRLVKQRRPFKCIVHGDGHAGNCAFFSDGTLELFDWQMWGIGHPAQELAQFFISNIPVNREFEVHVLRAYHEELVRMIEGTPLAYSFADLTTDVEIAQLDVLAAEMYRRGKSETPTKVKELTKRLGPVVTSYQRVCTVREIRGLRRFREWLRNDPQLNFGRPKSRSSLTSVLGVQT